MVKSTNIIFLLIITLIINLTLCKIRVHVVPHSHDDVGWLKTMKEYYADQPKCVKCILDKIVPSLKGHKERTFVYVEMAFFEQWYKDQKESVKEDIKSLLKEGRLEFANAGWVMNDEACALEQDIIDQMRLGLNFVKEEFDYKPKVAWYIDPFGHSKTNAVVMARLGFEYMVMVRIDYKEKEKRIHNKELEFIWKPYFDLDQGQTKIFTHITFNHYSPKPSSQWDQFLDYSVGNVESKLETLYKILEQQANAYKTNNLLFLFGDDFTFGNAPTPFENIEKLMKAYRSDPHYRDKIELFYSTPQKYFSEITSQGVAFPEWRNFDFFPYADDPKTYWTGYFTSRPYLKGFIRDVRKYLYHSSLFFLNYVAQNKDQEWRITEYIEELDHIRRTLAIGQHHDGVSGTARDYVSEDYLDMMEKAVDKIKWTIGDYLFGYYAKDIKVCIPAVSEFACYDNLYKISSLKDIKILVINYEVDSLIPFTLKIDTSNVDLLIDNQPLDKDVYCYSENECFVTFLLDFTNINSKQGKKYKILNLRFNSTPASIEKTLLNDHSQEVLIYENEKSKLTFNCQNGFKYFLKEANIEYNFSVKNGIYKTRTSSKIRSSGDNLGGAYIMSPSTEFPDYSDHEMKKSFYFSGKNVFHLLFKFVYTTVRINIYKNPHFDGILEIKTVMPNTTENDKEFLLIVQSDIDNNNSDHGNLQFFTDTNGSIMIERIKDFRFGWEWKNDEVVSSNFYPVNSVLSIKDNSDKQRILNIHNDRSQAATSMKKGEVYFVLNRLSSGSDNRGLPGGINESRMKNGDYHYLHYLTIGDESTEIKINENLINRQRQIYDLINRQPLFVEFASKIDEKTKLIPNLEVKNQLDLDFIIVDPHFKNCLKSEIYVMGNNKFLIQVSNNFNDPFFLNPNDTKDCNFSFNYEKLKIGHKVFEVELDGYTKVPTVLAEKHKRGFLSFRENLPTYTSHTLKPFEFKTFLVEFEN